MSKKLAVGKRKGAMAGRASAPKKELADADAPVAAKRAPRPAAPPSAHGRTPNRRRP